MSYRPKEISEIKLNPSGGYTARTYNFDDWRDMHLLVYFFVFLIFLCLFPIVGCLLFLLALCFDEQESIGCLLISTFISGYFLYDLKHEWFLTFLLGFIYDKDKWFGVYEIINWCSLSISGLFLIIKLLSAASKK